MTLIPDQDIRVALMEVIAANAELRQRLDRIDEKLAFFDGFIKGQRYRIERIEHVLYPMLEARNDRRNG